MKNKKIQKFASYLLILGVFTLPVIEASAASHIINDVTNHSTYSVMTPVDTSIKLPFVRNGQNLSQAQLTEIPIHINEKGMITVDPNNTFGIGSGRYLSATIDINTYNPYSPLPSTSVRSVKITRDTHILLVVQQLREVLSGNILNQQMTIRLSYPSTPGFGALVDPYRVPKARFGKQNHLLENGGYFFTPTGLNNGRSFIPY